jgi:hypothetical protein
MTYQEKLDLAKERSSEESLGKQLINSIILNPFQGVPDNPKDVQKAYDKTSEATRITNGKSEDEWAKTPIEEKESMMSDWQASQGSVNNYVTYVKYSNNDTKNLKLGEDRAEDSMNNIKSRPTYDVVNNEKINVTDDEFFKNYIKANGKGYKKVAIGEADPKNRIIANNPEFSRGDVIQITNPDGNETRTILVGQDPGLLKRPVKDFPIATQGDFNEVVGNVFNSLNNGANYFNTYSDGYIEVEGASAGDDKTLKVRNLKIGGETPSEEELLTILQTVSKGKRVGYKEGMIYGLNEDDIARMSFIARSLRNK